MMNKLFLIFVILISAFISINSLFFLPVTAFLITTLFTNTNEFKIEKNKKAIFYFTGIILILTLITISRIS